MTQNNTHEDKTMNKDDRNAPQQSDQAGKTGHEQRSGQQQAGKQQEKQQGNQPDKQMGKQPGKQTDSKPIASKK